MVTLGSDSDKKTHTLVAVDGNGRQLGSRTVQATGTGHLEALHWAEQWPQRKWALEDCRHLEGCAGLTAAKIVGETADVSRFGSRGAHAMNNGTAPSRSGPATALATGSTAAVTGSSTPPCIGSR